MKKLITFLMFLYVAFACHVDNTNFDLLPVQSGSKYGYINKSGQYQINPQFDKATFFRNGVALVKSGSLWGYIDTKGNYIVNPVYKEATIFQDGVAWTVEENGAPTAIDTKGNILFTLKEAISVSDFSDGLAVYTVSDPDSDSEYSYKYGYVNKSGETVIPPTLEYATDFSEGLAAVGGPNRKYGYINKKGEVVINYQFKLAKAFRNGRATVSNDDGQVGTIDQDGRYDINPQFSKMFPDGKNYLVSLQGSDNFGWCDKKGKFFINPQFSMAFPFLNQNRAIVSMDDKCGYIDKKGKIVINPQFNDATPFINGFAFVRIGDKWGTIDADGKYIINPQFDGVAYDVFDKFFIEDRFREYYSVNSDYFDVDGIVSQLRNILSKENIDGFINFDQPLSSIMEKYGMEEGAINRTKSLQLIKTLTLTKDAVLSISMGGDFYNKVSDGWWGYNYVLNKNAKPDKLELSIELKRNGRNKEELLSAALMKAFDEKSKNALSLDYGKFHLAFNTSSDKVVISVITSNIFDNFFKSNSSSAGIQVAKDEFKATAPASVAMEEQFKLQYTIGSVTATDLHLADIQDFDVLMGPTRAESHSTMIVEGKPKTEDQLTFTYILMPKKAGTFIIPGATVKSGGKTYTSNSVEIKVTSN